MMNLISGRVSFPLLALALLGLSAACQDSGHSLGNSRILDAGSADVFAPTRDAAGSGGGGAAGSTAVGGSKGSGGAAGSTAAGGTTGSGGAPGGGGSSTAVGGSKGSGGATGGGGGGTVVGGSTGSGGAAGGAAGGKGGTSAASDAGAMGGDAASGTCGLVGESCANRPCCGPLVCLTSFNPPSCYESYPPAVDSGGAGSDAGAARDSNPVPDGAIDTPASCPLPEGCGDAAGTVDTSTACPSTPPASGSTCVGQTSCFYDDCPSAGRTQATCTAGQWVVEAGACGIVTCLGVNTGTTCPSGQVCLVRAGGSLSVQCIANGCGTGPASSDCSTFTTGCTPEFNLTAGVTYYCNTCPAGETCA